MEITVTKHYPDDMTPLQLQEEVAKLFDLTQQAMLRGDPFPTPEMDERLAELEEIGLKIRAEMLGSSPPASDDDRAYMQAELEQLPEYPDSDVPDPETLQRKLDELEKVDPSELAREELLEHSVRISKVIKFLDQTRPGEILGLFPEGRRAAALLAKLENATIAMKQKEADDAIRQSAFGSLRGPVVRNIPYSGPEDIVDGIRAFVADCGSINFVQLAVMWPDAFYSGEHMIALPDTGETVIVWGTISDLGTKVIDLCLSSGLVIASAPPQLYAAYRGFNPPLPVGELHPKTIVYNERRWFPAVIRSARGAPKGATVH